MITELKQTNLIAVEVPINACNYRIVRNKSLFFNNNDEPSVPRALELSNNYKILGEVTKDKVGFDVEPCVDKYNNGAYRDYKDNYPFYPDFDTPNICLTNEESFYSLLAANGLYFENPLEWEKKAYLFKGSENSWGSDDLARWQSFEDKLITGKLLILEKL